MIKDSGKQREFATGSHRDSAEGKPRMELLPLPVLMELAMWYGAGAEKYGDNDFLLGQPQSDLIGSMLRHTTKFVRGDTDERHDLAMAWNALAIVSTVMYHMNDPRICDVSGKWYDENGKPTGMGSYENMKKRGKVDDTRGV